MVLVRTRSRVQASSDWSVLRRGKTILGQRMPHQPLPTVAQICAPDQREDWATDCRYSAEPILSLGKQATARVQTIGASSFYNSK